MATRLHSSHLPSMLPMETRHHDSSGKAVTPQRRTASTLKIYSVLVQENPPLPQLDGHLSNDFSARRVSRIATCSLVNKNKNMIPHPYPSSNDLWRNNYK